MGGFPFRAGIVPLVAIFLFISASHAVPVAYDEAISGELSNENPLTLFTLDVGANTVRGLVLFGPGADHDGFAFTVPPGSSMTGGTLDAQDIAGNITTISWQLRTGHSWGGGTPIQLIATFVPDSTSIPQLPAGAYHMFGQGIGAAGSAPTNLASYTFTFNVVPEPASLSILALGAVALRRRRQARQRNIPHHALPDVDRHPRRRKGKP